MKYCTKCNLEKSFDNFHFRKDRKCYHSWCKKCMVTVGNARYRERKRTIVELFGGKCLLCGYCKNINALDFHHIDPKTKDGSITSLRQTQWKKLLNELKKCILVCKNCHAEIHWPEKHSEHKIDNSLKIKATGQCKTCGDEVYGTIFCSRACVDLSKRKVKRPSYSELAKLIEEMPMTRIGVKYGVSDNAIRKWAKLYGLILS